MAQGMSVFGTDVKPEEYRGHWGIPFARPGNAVDYAQCIFGLATVSRTLQTSRRSQADIGRTNTSREQNMLSMAVGSLSNVSELCKDIAYQQSSDRASNISYESACSL